MKRCVRYWRGIAPCVLVFLFAAAASGQEPGKFLGPPKIDHILLEVVDLRKSIAFYHDLLGLEIKSQSKDFADAAIRKRLRFPLHHSLGLGREAPNECPTEVGDVSAFRSS
jgi:hypothetical protein